MMPTADNDEGRYRLLGEIVTATRAAVGDDFALMVKMNIDDGVPPPAMSPTLAATYAGWMVRDGIDCLELSAGGGAAPYVLVRGEHHHEDFASMAPWPFSRALLKVLRGQPATPLHRGVQRAGSGHGQSRSGRGAPGAGRGHAHSLGHGGLRDQRDRRPDIAVTTAGPRAGPGGQVCRRPGDGAQLRLVQPLPGSLLPRPSHPMLRQRPPRKEERTTGVAPVWPGRSRPGPLETLLSRSPSIPRNGHFAECAQLPHIFLTLLGEIQGSGKGM